MLATALTSWHEGILLQSTHPCMALVAYVGCIEQMAGSVWVRGELDRRASASELSSGRFKPVAALAAMQEELDLFDEMKVLRPRSKSAHGAPIVESVRTTAGTTREKKAITSIVVATSSFDKANYDVATAAVPTYFLAVRQLVKPFSHGLDLEHSRDTPGPWPQPRRHPHPRRHPAIRTGQARKAPGP